MIDVMIGISKSSAVLPEPVVRDRHNIYCKDTGLDLWLNKLLEEFRRTFMNIDVQIINELNDLFFGLWE